MENLIGYRKPIWRSLPIFLCLINSVKLIQIDLSSRIINGNESKIHSHPHQIQILSTKIPIFLCTGSLIHAEWILTTDDCAYRLTDDNIFPLMAISGSHRHLLPELTWQLREFDREAVQIHPNFSQEHRLDNDLVLVHIYPPFKLNINVSTIVLPFNTGYLTPSKSNGTISGWGTILNQNEPFGTELAEIKIEILDKQTCISEYEDQEEIPDFEINLCAGNMGKVDGLCHGDLGAPLEYYDMNDQVNYLIGIGSASKEYRLIPDNPSNPIIIECSRENRPDLYTRVSKFVPWIEQVIGEKLANNTFPSTTTTSTTEPPAEDHEIICEAIDQRGILWRGKKNENVWKKCPGLRGGEMTWLCTQTGTFFGQNPIYNCKSDWIYYAGQYRLGIKFFISNQEEYDEIILVSDLLQVINSRLVSANNNPQLDNDFEYFGQEIENILEITSNSIKNIRCNPLDLNGFQNVAEKITKFEVISLGNIFKSMSSWNDINDQETRSQLSTEIIRLIEKSAFDSTSRIAESKLESRIEKDFQDEQNTFRITIGIENVFHQSNETLKFPKFATEKDSYIEMPSNWKDFLISTSLMKNGIQNFEFGPDICNFNQGIKYTGIQLESKLLKEKFSSILMENDKNGIDYKINGDILTFSVQTPINQKMVKNIILNDGTIKIRFKLSQEFKLQRHKKFLQKCVFWDKEQLIWSAEGCYLNKNESDNHFTVCVCNHLTSFAVLVGNEIEDPILEILTIALCSMSNMALIATVFILQHGKKSTVGALPGMQATILTNLCATLFIGNIFFILLNPAYFNDKMPRGLCMTIGIISHYVFLCSFNWMAIFGWHVYRLIVFVFNTGGSFSIGYHIFGYGFPLIIVSFIAGIGQENAYSDDSSQFCWLKNPWTWSFIIPVFLITFMNIIVLSITLKKLYGINVKRLDEIRASQAKLQKPNIRGFLSMSFILGITWLPGFIYLIDEEDSLLARISAYIFTILNASQGIFIFIFQYSLRNRRIRLTQSRSITRQNTKTKISQYESASASSSSNSNKYLHSSKKFSFPNS